MRYESCVVSLRCVGDIVALRREARQDQEALDSSEW
jgi:hypothetical protein